MKHSSVFILLILTSLVYAGVLKDKPKEEVLKEQNDFRKQESRQFAALAGVIGNAISGALGVNRVLAQVPTGYGQQYVPNQYNNYVVGKPQSGIPLGMVNPRPVITMNPNIGTGQIPFGQYGFYPDYIQPPNADPSIMASYPNFDYIASYLPGWENLLFSPNPLYLRPEGDTWTGLENDKIPVVWKPITDYPFGNDGEQPYRELMRHFEHLSSMGVPVHIFEKIINEIRDKKQNLLNKIGKPHAKPVDKHEEKQP